MKRLLSLLLVGASLGSAASIGMVEASPADNGVNVSTAVQGQFSSVFLGSLAQLFQVYAGQSWRIYYDVELRRERANWFDDAVVKDRFTYTIDFSPLLDPTAEPSVDVTLASDRSGTISSTTCYSTEEVAAIVYRLGVLLSYQWTGEDGGEDFHVRVKAAQSVPIEADDETDWADSPSFTVAGSYCSSGEGDGSVVEDVGEFLGINNAPKVPECCDISSYQVRVGEELRVTFQSFDPDDDDMFTIVVRRHELGDQESGWLGGSQQWGSYTATATFSEPGVREIVARAIDDEGAPSDWTEPIFVTVTE